MFVAFEGIDGSGKSTQAKRFAEFARGDGSRRVVEVREPGGTRVGEDIRRILLDPESGDLSVETEVFLFMAARSHLCRELIAPALERGEAVIADRFLVSSVVYQGIVGEFGADRVLELGRTATRGVVPDVTFVVDVDPEVGFSRIGSEPDRVEQKGLDFQKRLRDGYLHVASTSDRIVVVDGAGSIDDVAKRVLSEWESRS
ncbi:MAG: dTMP kinase [Planctomycetota bacterium]